MLKNPMISCCYSIKRKKQCIKLVNNEIIERDGNLVRFTLSYIQCWKVIKKPHKPPKTSFCLILTCCCLLLWCFIFYTLYTKSFACLSTTNEDQLFIKLIEKFYLFVCLFVCAFNFNSEHHFLISLFFCSYSNFFFHFTAKWKFFKWGWVLKKHL